MAFNGITHAHGPSPQPTGPKHAVLWPQQEFAFKSAWNKKNCWKCFATFLPLRIKRRSIIQNISFESIQFFVWNVAKNRAKMMLVFAFLHISIFLVAKSVQMRNLIFHWSWSFQIFFVGGSTKIQKFIKRFCFGYYIKAFG